jgi:hypothetical protein
MLCGCALVLKVDGRGEIQYQDSWVGGFDGDMPLDKWMDGWVQQQQPSMEKRTDGCHLTNIFAGMPVRTHFACPYQPIFITCRGLFLDWEEPGGWRVSKGDSGPMAVRLPAARHSAGSTMHTTPLTNPILDAGALGSNWLAVPVCDIFLG